MALSNKNEKPAAPGSTEVEAVNTHPAGLQFDRGDHPRGRLRGESGTLASASKYRVPSIKADTRTNETGLPAVMRTIFANGMVNPRGRVSRALWSRSAPRVKASGVTWWEAIAS